jgi:hypothetical protein
MSFFRELAERARKRVEAPGLQTQALPQINPVPTQIGGIGSMLPMQTITLPGGQTIQIPQFDMEEVNANLLAAGITPQVTQPIQPRRDYSGIPSPDPKYETFEDYMNRPEEEARFRRMPVGMGSGLANPREDFMSIERMPQDITPVSPVPATNPRANDVRTPNIPSIPEGLALPGESFVDFIQREGGNPRPAGVKEGVPTQSFLSDVATPAPAITGSPVAMSSIEPESITTLPAPLAPYTGAQASPADMPFVSSVRQAATGLDPLTEQLLFGIGGEGGFIPGAMRAAERTFFNPDGTPRVVEEQVAGFTPDQLRAAELARQGVGVQDRFIEGAEGAFGSGIDALGRGFGRARGFAGQGLEATRAGLGDLTSGLSEQERISRGATGQFGQRLGGLGRQAMRSTADFGGRLGESESLLRGTTGAYDPSLTSAFFDPFEDRVVQQTISDVLEQGAQADIAARAGDIGRGGESAFGSRARLGASERQRALGRGLGEAISGIRSRGFTEAQRTGLSEFARQRAAERAASSGLAGLSASRLGAQQQLGGTLRGLSADQLAAQQGLAGTLGALGSQRFGGQQALAGALTGLGGMESQLAQREQAAQFGLGSALQGLGAQAQGAQATDIAQLYGMGTQQQALSQAQLDAQRRNQIQAQQAPLAQYQALAPFVSMAPAGQFQTVTDFAPPPSPMQVGIGTGLSTLGALGNLYGGG